MLIGAAMHVEVLKVASILSLSLQDKTLDEGKEKMYQGTTLHKFSQAILQHCHKEALEDLKRINDKMRN